MCSFYGIRPGSNLGVWCHWGVSVSYFHLVCLYKELPVGYVFIYILTFLTLAIMAVLV